MVRDYEDYSWSNRVPVGEGALGGPCCGAPHFRFVTVEGGARVEQYGEHGQFLKLCYVPGDMDFPKSWQKERYEDGRRAAIRDEHGAVVRYETYAPLPEKVGAQTLVETCVYNAEGRLIMTMTERSVSPAAYDVEVTDCLGKPMGVIHHRDIDKGEPFTIDEDWR